MKGLVIIALFTLCINGSSGASVKSPTLFIIDGNIVPRERYPFAVSIQRYGKNICGGIIINETTVLTAAHCLFMNPDYRNLQVVVGVTDLNSYSWRQVRRISDEIKIHPKFRNTHVYDIALFKVNKPFYFNTYVNAVELEDYYVPYKREGFVAGWGLTRGDDESSSSSDLLEAEVTILSHSECYDEYGDDVEKGLLCSLPSYDHEDACQGDSGGPLMHNNKLVGIISSGNECGSTTRPAVHTHIFYFIDWIKNNISNECDIS